MRKRRVRYPPAQQVAARIGVLQQGDRSVDVKKAVVEPLPLCSTLGKDPHSRFPLVTAKKLLGK